jgi:hypothetical protein
MGEDGQGWARTGQDGPGWSHRCTAVTSRQRQAHIPSPIAHLPSAGVAWIGSRVLPRICRDAHFLEGWVSSPAPAGACVRRLQSNAQIARLLQLDASACGASC